MKILDIIKKSFSDFGKNCREAYIAAGIQFLFYLPVLVMISMKTHVFIMAIYYIIVSGLLSYGINYYFLKLIRGEKTGINDIFILLKDTEKRRLILKTQALIWVALIFTIGVATLVIGPVLSIFLLSFGGEIRFDSVTNIINILGYSDTYDTLTVNENIYTVTATLTAEIMVLLTAITVYSRFSQAFNICIDKQAYLAYPMCVESVELMKGKNKKFILLFFVFSILEILLFFFLFRVGGYLIMPIKCFILQNFYQELYLEKEKKYEKTMG